MKPPKRSLGFNQQSSRQIPKWILLSQPTKTIQGSRSCWEPNQVESIQKSWLTNKPLIIYLHSLYVYIHRISTILSSMNHGETRRKQIHQLDLLMAHFNSNWAKTPLPNTKMSENWANHKTFKKCLNSGNAIIRRQKILKKCTKPQPGNQSMTPNL